MALGADAVAIGTVALIAMGHGQATAGLPFHGPTNLVLSKGSNQMFDRDLAAERLTNWLVATREELGLICQSLGLADVSELSPRCLAADDPVTARALGIAWYGEPAAEPTVDLTTLARQVRIASRQTAAVWDRLLRNLPTPRRPPPVRTRRRAVGSLVGGGHG